MDRAQAELLGWTVLRSQAGTTSMPREVLWVVCSPTGRAFLISGSDKDTLGTLWQHALRNFIRPELPASED